MRKLTILLFITVFLFTFNTTKTSAYDKDNPYNIENIQKEKVEDIDLKVKTEIEGVNDRIYSRSPVFFKSKTGSKSSYDFRFKVKDYPRYRTQENTERRYKKKKVVKDIKEAELLKVQDEIGFGDTSKIFHENLNDEYNNNNILNEILIERDL